MALGRVVGVVVGLGVLVAGALVPRTFGVEVLVRLVAVLGVEAGVLVGVLVGVVASAGSPVVTEAITPAAC